MKSYTIVVNGKTYDLDVYPKQGSAQQPASRPEMIQPKRAAETAPAAPAAPAAKPAAPAAQAVAPSAGDKVINSPMPGTINAVNVKVGDHVESNTVIFVLEAMKMENELSAGRSGTVKEICVAKGDMVESDTKLAVIG